MPHVNLVVTLMVVGILLWLINVRADGGEHQNNSQRGGSGRGVYMGAASLRAVEQCLQVSRMVRKLDLVEFAQVRHRTP